MKSHMMFDVAIIGGSFAGLSAALPLARARRRLAIFDSGLRRNRFAATSHGFLAQDGREPGAIVADARRQLDAYSTVQWFDSTVIGVAGGADAFEVESADAKWQVRRVILASGVSDTLPSIPGLADRWGRSVFHCPYCHGYELQQDRIGVIATGPLSIHQAQLLSEWGSVTFFLNGAFELSEEEARELASRGVAVDSTPVVGIADEARVQLAGGRSEDFAGLFTASRTAPSSQVPGQLGCELEEGPMGSFVKTDAMKETTVAGVFACGDLARAAGNVALAVGDGALAGTATHASLVFPAWGH
jgi:thioredoxin reductase